MMRLSSKTAFASALPSFYRAQRFASHCSSLRAASVVRASARNDEAALVSAAVNRGADRPVAERAVRVATRALQDWKPAVSEFLAPPEANAVSQVLSSLSDLQVLVWGGYTDATRSVLAAARADILPNEDALLDAARNEMKLLKIAGNFHFDKATHRDFMGAVLGVVSRRVIGDVLVQGESGAQVIVQQGIADVLCSEITRVRTVPVRVEIIDWSELELPPKRVKELQTVEASMRVDALGSFGFKMSRTKMSEAVRAGGISINYKVVTTPSRSLKEGDVVSFRGKGKIEIGECGRTAKGSYRVKILKYL